MNIFFQLLKPYIISFLLFATLLVFAFFSIPMQQKRKMSLHMDSKKLLKGKYLHVEADIYYKSRSGELLMHYLHPENYVLMTNSIGEVKAYYPKENKVMIKHGELFSSENNLFFYFMSNEAYDMGLNHLGFTVTDTKFDDGLMITTWLPPTELLKVVHKIEIVYEDYLPVYSAYFGPDNKIIRKIYYSDYSYFDQFSLPLRVTEIEYTQEGDSIVSRLIYSDVKVNQQTSDQYFNFSIPENAKIIE